MDAVNKYFERLNVRSDCVSFHDSERHIINGMQLIIFETMVWSVITWQCFVPEKEDKCTVVLQLWPIHLSITGFFGIYVIVCLYIHLNKHTRYLPEQTPLNSVIPNTYGDWESL